MSLNKTKIEWVKSPDGSKGMSWNPITGCLNHINGMCKGGNFPCYAYKLANGRLKKRYQHNTSLPEVYGKELVFDRGPREDSFNKHRFDPFYPRFWESRQGEIMGVKDGKGIFVCNMSDLFGIGVPEQWTDIVLRHITFRPKLRFYLLTKQPQNLIKFSPFPDNCWVGVTLTGKEPDFYKRIEYLQHVEAHVKFISFEPLLATTGYPERLPSEFLFEGINWLIIGAQTKPTVMPKISWVKEIVEAADKAGVKVFLKDSLKTLLPKDIEECPDWATTTIGHNSVDYMYELRQEMPE